MGETVIRPVMTNSGNPFIYINDEGVTEYPCKECDGAGKDKNGVVCAACNGKQYLPISDK